ncbi:MAG: hypothetical protein WB660_24030, partial [Candidatus Sulfotelmatobacter sp.]
MVRRWIHTHHLKQIFSADFGQREEAVSGVKGELAVKLFGTDLKVLEQKAIEMQDVMSKIPGVAD